MSGICDVYDQPGRSPGPRRLPCARAKNNPQTPQTPQAAGQRLERLAGFNSQPEPLNPANPARPQAERRGLRAIPAVLAGYANRPDSHIHAGQPLCGGFCVVCGVTFSPYTYAREVRREGGMTKRPASPEDMKRIAEHAQQHLMCEDCAAAPGEPCTRPGSGRSVHKSRYVSAAIEVRRQARAAQRTPEQEAELAVVLAMLPRMSAAEVEAGRSAAGGFTRAQLAAWGVPWPPPAGWLRTLLREEDVPQ